MDRKQKQDLVSDLQAVFEQAGSVIITHYSGVKVGELEDLRGRLREAGGRFKVTKNRLTRLALEGTPYAGLVDMFTGPTGIAYAEDPVVAARVAVKYAKDNDKLIIVGGAVGENVLDMAGIKALADLPSLDELRGKLVGLLQAPATKVAGVLQAPARQLVQVVSAYSRQDA